MESTAQRMRQQPPRIVLAVAHQRALRVSQVLPADDFALAEFHGASVRDRSRISKNFPHSYFFDHRAIAALRALRVRCSAVSFRARAFPPFKPPSRPSATAAAFFFVFAMDGKSHNPTHH